jgi:hypothetical protein
MPFDAIVFKKRGLGIHWMGGYIVLNVGMVGKLELEVGRTVIHEGTLERVSL